VHLENLLSQSQAAEAEAIRQAGEATQRLSAASAQHVSQLESELQQVCFGFLDALMMQHLHTRLECILRAESNAGI